MPAKRNPEILEKYFHAYNTHGSFAKTAKALGVPVSHISRAVYQHTGRCDCGRQPEPGFRSCAVCLARSKERSARRHDERRKDNTCRECGEPLSPKSRRFCLRHLELLLTNQRNLRKRRRASGTCQFCPEPATSGLFCEAHRAYARKKGIAYRSRMAFGGLLESVLARDKKTCQICGDRKRRIEVHHINGRANTMENLITLCAYCHKVLTFLEHCNNPEAVYAFFIAHSPKRRGQDSRS